MTTDPRWLTMLRTVRLRQEVTHSDRELAKRSGLSHTTVTNIFKGTAHPQRETITRLVFSITGNPHERMTILDTYDAHEEQLQGTFVVGADRPWLEIGSDTARLADAICDLAQAITDMAASLHAYRISQEEQHRTTPDHH